MNNKIKIAIMFLIVLTLGIMIGFFLKLQIFNYRGHSFIMMRRFNKATGMDFTSKAKKEIIDIINPTKEQRIEIDKILETYNNRFVDLQRSHRGKMIELIFELIEDIKPILTEDQRKKIEEKMKQIEKNHQNLK